MGLLFCLLSHVKFLFALNPPSLPRRYNGHPPPQLGLKKTCPKADLVPVVPVVLVIRNAANFLKELAEVPAAEEGNLVRIAYGLTFLCRDIPDIHLSSSPTFLFGPPFSPCGCDPCDPCDLPLVLGIPQALCAFAVKSGSRNLSFAVLGVARPRLLMDLLLRPLYSQRPVSEGREFQLGVHLREGKSFLGAWLADSMWAPVRFDVASPQETWRS